MARLPDSMPVGYESIILALLSASLLPGCADIVMTAGSKDGVTLRSDWALVSEAEVSEGAAFECARYGRVAEFVSKDQAGIGMRYSTFRCVDKPKETNAKKFARERGVGQRRIVL